MLLFTGDRSKANQTRAWKKTTEYTSPVPHAAATVLLDGLPRALLLPAGVVCAPAGSGRDMARR